MKTCNRCNAEKALDCFAKNGKSGLHPVCKVCRAEIERIKRAADPEKIREQERIRYAANPSIKNDAYKRFYAANREAMLGREKVRYAKNGECIRAQKKEYREANPGKIRALNGTRRATLRLAMPVWADRKAINVVYAEATRLWRETGEPHHVDHIIPLSHKLVCGLHVPGNLQVLSGAENMRKSNRFE